MNGNNDWDENDNTDQVENDIVEGLMDPENQDEISHTGVGNKFQVIDYSEALDKANNTKKTTLPIMSKYERAKIIGYRATQIAKGATPLINTQGIKDPYDKAEKELLEKKTPLIIRRTLPDNTHEDWKIEEFLF